MAFKLLTEVEGVGLFGSAEVVQFEYQMLREVALISPYYPPNACENEAILVAGSID